jgi:hypothetical protein
MLGISKIQCRDNDINSYFCKVLNYQCLLFKLLIVLKESSALGFVSDFKCLINFKLVI